nr:MAG TPA: hypothetical protein [Caudoviricetes sp.]
MSKYVSICEEPPYIILPLESHEGGGHNTSLQSPWLILLFRYFSIRQDYFIIQHSLTGQAALRSQEFHLTSTPHNRIVVTPF